MKLANLFEQATTEVAIIFGRFNPPHKGHRAAWEMMSKYDYWYVGTNSSTQGPKDPLPFEVKIKAMTAIYPELEGHLIAETSWLTMASQMYEKFPNASLLCFTDESWVTKTITDYNGKKGSHGYYNFQEIKQIPTPRLSSATDLRNAVISGDRQAFAKAAGVDADLPVDGKPFFDLVAEYLLPYAEKSKKSKVVKENKESITMNRKPEYYAIVHKVNNQVLSTHRDLESAKDEWRGLEHSDRPYFKVVRTTKAPADWDLREAQDRGWLVTGIDNNGVKFIYGRSSTQERAMDLYDRARHDAKLSNHVRKSLRVAPLTVQELNQAKYIMKQSVPESQDDMSEAKNRKPSLKTPKDNPCWKGYHPVGTKKKNGRTVPNCVPKESVAEGSDNPLRDIDTNAWHLIQTDKPIAINFPDENRAKSFHSGHGYGRETKVMHGSQVRRNAYLKHNPGVINWPEYSKDVSENADSKKTFVITYYSPKTDRTVTKTVRAENESDVWDGLKSRGIDVVSVKEKSVAEGSEQQFKFDYTVFTHNEMQDFRERDLLDSNGEPLVDMDIDEIIISASSVSDAYKKLRQKFPNQAVFVHSSTPIVQGVAEGGPFSYGAKKPRKGSVADLADKKRQEQEKNRPPIEPRDQRVGTAKVTKGVAEGLNSYIIVYKDNNNKTKEAKVQSSSANSAWSKFEKAHPDFRIVGFKDSEQGVAEAQRKPSLKNPEDNPCWKGYKPVGTKKKNGRTVPNCVPKESVAEGLLAEMDMSSPEFQQALARLKKLAAQGPLKTVQDPRTGKYKNVPVDARPENKTVTESTQATYEDVLNKLKARLGDYLKDVADAVVDDGEIRSEKPTGDQVNSVKTVVTDDGHEIRIHGNEDDGFRITIKNKDSKAKFNNLKEAEMAVEMYCNRRKNSVKTAQDYVREK